MGSLSYARKYRVGPYLRVNGAAPWDGRVRFPPPITAIQASTRSQIWKSKDLAGLLEFDDHHFDRLFGEVGVLR